MSVTFERRGDIALVVMNNPPVNAIGRATREGLGRALEWLAKQEGLAYCILHGAGSVFAAGADAREFDGPAIPPHLPDIIAEIEECAVPWVAAIEGFALGGGAELLLGCRYRVAAPGAKIGFPEVTLGVIPGAGGTQRLGRLIGLPDALGLISEGKPVAAHKALKMGLVDAVVADPLNVAMTLDAATFRNREPVRRQRPPRPDPAAVEAARARAEKRQRGQNAPLEAIDLVAQSVDVAFDAATKQERETFLRLRQSPQAKALRHMFFAERGARPPKQLPKVECPECVAVIGGGTMGASISYGLISAGVNVTLIETDAAACERARNNVETIIAASKNRGLINEERAQAVRALLTISDDFSDAAKVELAIEAVFENAEVKRDIFAKLDAHLPATATLASNTSYLDLNEIAAAVRDPSRVVGLHFFAPAHIMKLLEIVKGDATSDQALGCAFSIGRRLKKVPVVAGVCDGFIGNRILARYREAADRLMLHGAAPAEIDAAMVAFGYPMGPYAAQDLSGLDIAYANRRRQEPFRDPTRLYVRVADEMVEAGKLGKKTGNGWYIYDRDASPVPDPRAPELARAQAEEMGLVQRQFEPGEISQDLVFAMVNEAAEILREGIASSEADIDLVSVLGYGFPRWRGGLMHYARAIGYGPILARLEALAEVEPQAWQVSPYLRKLAANAVANDAR